MLTRRLPRSLARCGLGLCVKNKCQQHAHVCNLLLNSCSHLVQSFMHEFPRSAAPARPSARAECTTNLLVNAPILTLAKSATTSQHGTIP
jgi:hypothetical protein